MVDKFGQLGLKFCFSPNSDTITGLVAGQHYQIFLMSESQYNKNSSVLWFTQSVFTDTILETEEIFSVHEIEFEAQIESGVGSKIEIEMQGLDFPWLRRSLYFLFRLEQFHNMTLKQFIQFS